MCIVMKNGSGFYRNCDINCLMVRPQSCHVTDIILMLPYTPLTFVFNNWSTILEHQLSKGKIWLMTTLNNCKYNTPKHTIVGYFSRCYVIEESNLTWQWCVIWFFQLNVFETVSNTIHFLPEQRLDRSNRSDEQSW